METCKVEFINTNGQKIVLNFTLHENGDLEYKPYFEPKVDPKTNLGLSGQLCEIFLSALYTKTDLQDTRDEKSNRKLES